MLGRETEKEREREQVGWQDGGRIVGGEWGKGVGGVENWRQGSF